MFELGGARTEREFFPIDRSRNEAGKIVVGEGLRSRDGGRGASGIVGCRSPAVLAGGRSYPLLDGGQERCAWIEKEEDLRGRKSLYL